MKSTDRIYAAIDLKSFYASAECADRELDPLDTNLVVADLSRTEKTICLAVSPSLKAYGIPGRPRLFEVISKMKQINSKRLLSCPERKFSGSSVFASCLKENPSLKAEFITAPPRMARYIELSAKIYSIYLKYAAKEDIHVYSVDEVFIDITEYLDLYKVSAKDYVMRIIDNILKETKITATAGIGTNLYLCKIAMDIVAKHMPPDKNGVRIAELSEDGYRRLLWAHRPITDFWRVGKGTASRLSDFGIYTMGDVARCSVTNEDLLYDLFGINAELLIDHAWGVEPCTIADIKAYKPKSSSLCSGQVLKKPYPFDKALLIVREMADLLSLDLVEKRLVTDQLVLDIGYDTENVSGKISDTTDRYGRKIPKPAHGSLNIGSFTSSSSVIINKADSLFCDIADENFTVRRITITANHVKSEDEADNGVFYQLDIFSDPEDYNREKEKLKKERRRQDAVLEIKKKFGKNAILRGTNLTKDSTLKDRNSQIGGHKA